MLQTGNGFQQFFLAVAGNTGNAQNLAAIHIKAHIVQHVGTFGAAHRKVADSQTPGGVLRRGAVDVQLHLLAHHHLSQAGFRCGGSFHRANVFALAQNCHAVRNRKHLMQLVGNDDHGLAIRLHVAHHGKQLFGFLRGQHGGGFVQDQDICTTEQHLYDFQRLLLAHAHLVHFLVQIQRKLVFFANRTGFVPHAAQVKFFAFVHAQGNVFHGGKHIHQFEVLVNHANAKGKGIARGTDICRLAIDDDLPAVRVIDTGDHIHQGCFAGAVLAQQGQNLPAADIHGNIMVCNDRTKSFGYMFQLDGVLSLRHGNAPLCKNPSCGAVNTNRGKLCSVTGRASLHVSSVCGIRQPGLHPR